MQRLDCHVKPYAWGKKGEQSEVARLFSAGHKNFRIDPESSYAELWMGTHPDGPARLRGTQMELSRFIALNANKEDDCHVRDAIHLPFIMKIMSIRHTLSLQVHPTKDQAARLHARDPINYPDRHHKPELAYALTKFELLCGFRPAKEISLHLKVFPELRLLMGATNSMNFESLIDSGVSENSDKAKEALAVCFRAMLDAQQQQRKLVKHLIVSMHNRIDQNEITCLSDDTIRVLRRIFTEFPEDVGCFAPLYLNHMILNPGECCYYAAEELHAYLSGECVECVGCSNNTIRAALTPKYIDVESLCEVLNYRMTDPSYYMVPAETMAEFPHVVEYAPDCKDFTLHQIKIPACTTKNPDPYQLPALDCGSIVVLVEGSGQLEECAPPSGGHKRPQKSMAVVRGDIVYIPPNQRLQFDCVTRPILAYRTFSYEDGPDHSNRNLAAPIVPQYSETKMKEEKPVKRPMKAVAARRCIERPRMAIKTSEIGRAEVFDVETEMDGFM